jgi:putative heme-binding domain-containing protein
MEPLVTGGNDFRPVGIAVAPDGSLYVTDWVDKSYSVHGKGRIWHIHAVKSKDTRFRYGISSPNRDTREKAARLRAAKADGRQNLRLEVVHDVDPRDRAAAVEALADVPDPNTDYLRVAVDDHSVEVRALAVRVMPMGTLKPHLAKLIEQSQPAAVRAEALRRDADPSTIKAVLAALDEPDPFLQQAARMALANMPEALSALDPFALPTAAQRLGAMLALRAVNETVGEKYLPRLLDDSDPSIRFAAIEWVGEEHVKELRPKIVEMLGGKADTRELFEACVAALELLDGTQRPDEFHGEQYVVGVLHDPHASNSMRRLALRMLRPDHPALTVALVKDFLASPDQTLRVEAIRSLRDSRAAGRTDLLAAVARDALNSTPLRAEAIVGLSDSEPQQELLLSLATGDNPAIQQESLRSLRGAPLSESQRGQLDPLVKKDRATADLVNFVLKAPTPSNPPRHDMDVWLKSLEGPGDAAAGERIFFHPKAAGCFRCHQIHGRGGHVGPDLSSAARLLGRKKLVESIVDPSKEIAPRFIPWSLITKDGRSFAGLLVTEGPGDLETYSDSAGKLFILSPANIEERHPLRTSIMPEGLADMLTIQEFQDLVAFLMQEEVK